MKKISPVCDAIFKCQGWESSYDQIIDIMDFSKIHGMAYTGKEFFFCPWCGKKLKDIHIQDLKAEQRIKVEQEPA